MNSADKLVSSLMMPTSLGDPIPPQAFYGNPRYSLSLVDMPQQSASSTPSTPFKLPSPPPRVPLTHQTNHRSTTAPDVFDASNVSQTLAPAPTRKTRAEFSHSDINKLINVVININPFMCKRSQTKAKWQKVLQTIQAEGGCIGRDWETVCNKMKSLIKYVRASASIY